MGRDTVVSVTRAWRRALLFLVQPRQPEDDNYYHNPQQGKQDAYDLDCREQQFGQRIVHERAESREEKDNGEKECRATKEPHKRYPQRISRVTGFDRKAQFVHLLFPHANQAHFRGQ
ncbi:MAG: hypothetical protein LBR14_01305 [Clostridiales Family XIII bacterium]|jgi:hypothetical protein|nr:hypothetical protein [Clostridiales Family XIII bacterium]